MAWHLVKHRGKFTLLFLPLCVFMVWRLAKHRDNFIFTLKMQQYETGYKVLLTSCFRVCQCYTLLFFGYKGRLHLSVRMFHRNYWTDLD